MKAPEALALYLRERANELAALGRDGAGPPIVAVAVGHEGDAALARAVMALWNRKGNPGDATVSG